MYRACSHWRRLGQDRLVPYPMIVDVIGRTGDGAYARLMFVFNGGFGYA